MEINLDLLQQLPAEEEAEAGLCTVTCYFSCFSTSNHTITCTITATFT